MTSSRLLPKVFLMLAVLTAVNCVMPLSLGCSLDINEQTIRCRSNNLDYIVKSMFILVPERRTFIASNQPIEPTTLAPVTVTVNSSNSEELLNSTNVTDNSTTTTTTASPTTTTTVTTTAASASVLAEPHEVDIFYCDVPELPNIFARFNASLRRIRVARSNVQLVLINAFEGLEESLFNLDLSGNKLRTVPLAVQNLTRLEVLNLRDNKIQVIAEGPTFSNTKRLRELYLGFNNLGYIDSSKLQLFPAVTKNPARKSNQLTPIGLTVFNLGNTTSSLEVLSLRGNGMHNYPEQLLTDFPRLKSLDLSFNSLVEIPEDAFMAMPELQFVNLDSNFIRTLKFTGLPETLKLFTLKNNPMVCDCNVKWMLDWIFINTSLTVLLPKCNAPFHLREISFLRLTSEKLCNQSHVTRQTVYVTDRDLSYFPQGVFQSFKLLDVRGEYQSIFISWKVDLQFYLSQREWLIIYRTFADSIYRFNRTVFASKSYTENQTDWSSVERVFSDTIKNLSAGEFYEVCMAVVENNINYVHLNHCRVAQTLKELISPSSQFSMGSFNQNQHTTTTAKPEPDYLIESDFVRIKAELKTITVFWNVTVQSKQSRTFLKDRKNGTATPGVESPLVLNTLSAIYNELKWKITYRRFATESSTAVTIMKNNYVVTGPNAHQYTIANLRPGTGYTVCFETVDDIDSRGNRLLESVDKSSTSRYVALDSKGEVCKEIETVSENKFPTTEVAVSTIITAVVTTVLVIAVSCFLPKMFRKKVASDKHLDEEGENTSQNTTNTDTGNSHLDHDEDEDSDDAAAGNHMHAPGNGIANGHSSGWKKDTYPRITTIFPGTEGCYRNGAYHGSFRNFNGIPPYPSYQFRNGTYPKSILKKSPSAPSLMDAMKPVSILKRPVSVNDERQIVGFDDSNKIQVNLEKTDHINSNEKNNNNTSNSDKNGGEVLGDGRRCEVEMKKIFTPFNADDEDSESDFQCSKA
ncbi:hypothetical protein CHUAL_011696 [Chamberlinius hualienensis]